MKEKFKKVGAGIKRAWKYSIHTWIFKCFAIALVIEIILEILGRRSIILGFDFLINSPLVYLYNVSIIFFTLLFALFLRKRVFGITVISFIWLICGIVNFVVLGYRVTPFAAIDFLMAKDVVSMLDVYFTKFQQVLLILLIVAVIVGLVFLFRKTPKFEGSRKVKGTMLACVIAWVVVWGFTKFGVKHNIISDDFANLGIAYQDYGFAYCFTNSIIDNGISKPENYSEETMLELKADLDNLNLTGKEKNPNIIYIQLESFFDPKTVNGLTLSEDPVPNFTKYKAEYPSGYLTVPCIGAGTANTEYEVMTGLESSSFGAGEYPYKTTVNKEPVVGIASILREEGYSAFAIHNNKGSFYDREHVYEEMGYNNFVSLEYMYNIQQTSTGWAKDYSLVGDIMDCLESTEGKDLVYTISVQGHGRYPDEVDSCEDHVQIQYTDEEMVNQFHYYVNQIYEMDEMIGQLKEALDDYGEDYVLVLYGDHLPSLNLTEESLSKGDLFQTEYVIVNNIHLKLEDKDIKTYELTARLLNALHKPLSYAEKADLKYRDEKRDEALDLIAYDMLFGDKFIYDGQNPVPENTMTMGIKPIIIDKVKNETDHIVVNGQNFNEYSVVYVDGDSKDTVFIDNNTLMVEEEQLEDGEKVVVNQVDKSHHILSGTEEYIFQK